MPSASRKIFHFCFQQNKHMRRTHFIGQRFVHFFYPISKPSYSEEKRVLYYSSQCAIQHNDRKVDNASTVHIDHKVRECWKCGTSLSNQTVLCGSKSLAINSLNERDGCGAVQRVAADNINFFQLFNLPTSYSIDDKALETAYKSLQKQLHPDKFAKASNQEKDISTETSALVNHAYSTLRSPLHRAEYMLWLLFRQKVYESEATRMDPGLMAEMFEWREKVDDAKSDAAQRKALISEVAQELSRCENNLKDLFSASSDNNIAEKVTMSTTKFKYFSKMMHELHENNDNDE